MGIGMARGRGRMALYEVIGKSKSLKELHPAQLPKVESERAKLPELAGPGVASGAKWPRKPRRVQFNAGRIEMSLPYPLASVFALGMVLAVLVAYRLGQLGFGFPAREAQSSGDTSGRQRAAAPPQAPAVGETTPPAGREPVAASKGDNCIVITQYQTDRHLKPVQTHFADNGIETVIEKINGWYFLRTKQLYENPLRSGTDGSVALKRIKEVGAQYKAPQGFESFKPNLFSDAYGKKVK
jgi:hypothetical protein